MVRYPLKMNILPSEVSLNPGHLRHVRDVKTYSGRTKMTGRV